MRRETACKKLKVIGKCRVEVTDVSVMTNAAQKPNGLGRLD